ncbi:MAG: hypothetical protein NT003_02250, partial [Candidatus Magasanikbacteria bacterium]|nr:hypothetical protein [Candidatus Magasanikbacteria bacterium]
MNQLIKQNDTEHRLEIQRDFKRLSDEMCVVVESFVIWKTLVFSRSALINSEQQAEKNVNTINIYKDFFSATEHAHMHMFIVGICKFFDHDTRSLTIKSLMKKIKSNLDIDAEGTLQIDVKFIQELINRNERLIDELDRIRCKQFA